MGFGLSFLGFVFLTMEAIGLDFLGYTLIGLGFYRVGRELNTYKGYTLAAYAAFIAAVPAVLNLYSFLTAFGLPALPELLVGIKGGTVAALSAVVCFAHCGSTARIAREGGAKVFSFRAQATAYLSAFYYAALLVYGFTGAVGSVASMIIIGKYVVPLLNAWLLFTCFTTITTKARAVKEKEIIDREIEVLERKRALKKAKDEED